MTAGPVDARPAATVVLLRPGSAGLEVLLTQRPTTMAFASDAHVFPGGRVDPDDAAPGLAGRSVRSAADASLALGGDLAPPVALAAFLAAIRELFEEAGVLLAETTASAATIAEGRSALLRGETTFPELAEALDLRLRTDLLVPLSRWVTPEPYPRRFDARFFAAALPDGATPTFEGGEVAAHAWLRPTDALAAMAAGRLTLWLPTSTTLQQLEHVASLDEIRERLAPGPLGEVLTETVDDAIVRIVMPAGGGVAGQPVCAYLVGRRRFVLVDPGDPTGPGLARALALAAERGGPIEAVAPDPRRSGPRGGCRGRRRAPWRPGPDRARRWPAAAVRRPRGRRSGPARGRRRRRAPHPHARPATGPPGLRGGGRPVRVQWSRTEATGSGAAGSGATGSGAAGAPGTTAPTGALDAG